MDDLTFVEMRGFDLAAHAFPRRTLLRFTQRGSGYCHAAFGHDLHDGMGFVQFKPFRVIAEEVQAADLLGGIGR